MSSQTAAADEQLIDIDVDDVDVDVHVHSAATTAAAAAPESPPPSPKLSYGTFSDFDRDGDSPVTCEDDFIDGSTTAAARPSCELEDPEDNAVEADNRVRSARTPQSH